MVKAVLQSIPSYLMSCFALPVGILKDLQSTIRRFWWGDGSERRLAWVSWDRLCRPKSVGGMGFRHLEIFNDSLLAKQLWRVITEPDRLLSQLLRAKYFPHGDVFRAELGARPSATWRSLYKARPLLKLGARVRIGDGLSTAIWGDPWLRDDGNFRIWTKRPVSTSFPNRVADLIDPSQSTWNRELIDNTFWPSDRVRIYSIPIGARTVPDMWVWHYTKNGKFSVKSCYHIAFNSRISDHSTSGYAGAHSGSTQHKWKFIWELNLPPKIRHFIWRASSDIIPTRAALAQRKIAPDSQCFRCGYMVESTLHVLQACGGAARLWQSHPFYLKLLPPDSTVWQWIDVLRKTLTEDLFLLALTVAWRLWGIRNDILHGNDGTSIDDVLSWSRMYLNEFHGARILARNIHTPPLPDAWSAPLQGWLKINVDAALPPGQQFFTVALVARDENGLCVRWATRQVHGRPNAEECEAFAALFALQYAKLQGWRSIVVEGDCLTVINALKANVASSAPIGVFVADCFSLISSFDSCEFSFIRRSGNSLAHCLATCFDLSCTEGSILPSNLANYA